MTATSMLGQVPGILKSAFGLDGVEYSSGATWTAIADAHYSPERANLIYDDQGRREASEKTRTISAPSATAPTLAMGQQVRIGGSSGTVYAVREIRNDSGHGIRSWTVERRDPLSFTTDRGATR